MADKNLYLEVLKVSHEAVNNNCWIRLDGEELEVKRDEVNRLIRCNCILVGARKIECLHRTFRRDHVAGVTRSKYTIRFLDTGEIKVIPGDVLARLLYDYKFISAQVYGTRDGIVHSKGTCNFSETEEDPILTPEEIAKAEEAKRRKERAERKRELARQKALDEKQRKINERLRRQKECQVELHRVPHEL